MGHAAQSLPTFDELYEQIRALPEGITLPPFGDLDIASWWLPPPQSKG